MIRTHRTALLSAVAAFGMLAVAAAGAPADAFDPPAGGQQLAQAQPGQGPGGQGPGGQGPGPGGPGPGMGPGQGRGPGGMGPGQGMGPGMMGPGQGMGPGMMGQGMMGRGMMRPGMMMRQGGGVPPLMLGMAILGGGGERNLSGEDVRAILGGVLAWYGNDRLEVGEVTETDDDTVTATLQTVEGSLVQRLRVDRSTGMIQPAE